MPTVPPRARTSKRYTIYALIDPRNQAIRYIGITEDVYQRMRQHSRCEGNNVEKNAWIEELQQEQLMFVMHSLEKVNTLEEALTREQHWIQQYLQQGAKLTNISGVPVDPSAPPQKRSKFASYEYLLTVYFKTADGRIVNFMRATNGDFDAYIRRFVPLAEDITPDYWSEDWKRIRVAHFADKNGIELELFDTPLDGESKYLWIVRGEDDGGNDSA